LALSSQTTSDRVPQPTPSSSTAPSIRVISWLSHVGNEDLTIKGEGVRALKVQQEAVIAHLEEDREAADKLHADAKKNFAATYARYRAEQARRAAAAAARAAASRGTSGGSGSSGAAAGVPAATTRDNCPLPNGSSFIDTWGYPRSGGRTHKGTDMVAAYGSTLVTMKAGTIRLNYHSLGGRQVYICGTDGITYYYAHLSGYASGLPSGQSVSQGQVVGFVGSMGNATTNVLHLGMIVGGQYTPAHRYCRPLSDVGHLFGRH
jgi:murein DD-endopeptidase MepM/ murein hydrolase activator NlpD